MSFEHMSLISSKNTRELAKHLFVHLVYSTYIL